MADLFQKNAHISLKIASWGVFGVADFVSGINFLENKMADPKWRTFFQKSSYLLETCILGGFWGR